MLGGWARKTAIVAAKGAHPLVGGVRARGGAVGCGRPAPARRAGGIAPHRRSLAARGPAAPGSPRRLRPRAHRAARRGASAGGGARVRPRAVLSPRTAAAHWGLLRTDQTRIDVSAPRGRHGAPGIRLHRSRSLDAQDTTTYQGIPTTTVHRTLLDVAAMARGGELERAVAQAERLRLYDHREIQAVLERANGHRGVGLLRHATSRTPKWTRNEWEAEFLRLLRDAGLPEPKVNEAFHAPGHGHCEPDYHWPEHRVILELDGFETHGTRAAFHADRAKDAALPRPQVHPRRRTRPRHRTPPSPLAYLRKPPSE